MSTCTRRPRRQVTSEEFRVALHGDPKSSETIKAAADNRNIIAARLARFRGQIPEDDLQACGLHALWRCLQYHNSSYGQKFTTSLYRFVGWECKREISRLAKEAKIAGNICSYDVDSCQVHNREIENLEELEHVSVNMQWLSAGQREIVQLYYFDGLTMEKIGELKGYSKEAARQRINRATALLKIICQRSLNDME